MTSVSGAPTSTKKWTTPPLARLQGWCSPCNPYTTRSPRCKSERTYDEIIFLTPDGEQLKQGRVNQLSLSGNLLMICGHYKGIDQRLRDHVVTLEISIGDYVLSGGELAAAVLTDALVRLVPGVIGDETSALSDSFQDGLLAPPVYTRPAEYNGWKVPDVLLSGNHAAIDKWQEEQALGPHPSTAPRFARRLNDGDARHNEGLIFFPFDLQGLPRRIFVILHPDLGLMLSRQTQTDNA